MSNQTETALVAIPAKSAEVATLFASSENIDKMVAMIEAKAREAAKTLPTDFSVKKNAAAFKSLAYNVARSKTAFVDAGKQLTEDARKQVKAVQAETKRIESALDDLKAEVLAPVVAWEEAEAARKNALSIRLNEIGRALDLRGDAAAFSAEIERVEAIEIGDDWQEVKDEAAFAKDNALAILRDRLATAQKAEADAAELARLREAEAEREAAERAAQAELEAERAKLVEAEAARLRYERQAEEAEAAKAQAEADLKAAQEQAERDRREAIQREADRIAAEEVAAINAENERIEAARLSEERRLAAEAEADALRKANAEMLDAATEEARAAIAAIDKRKLLAAIMAGEIPHVTFEIGANQ